MKLIGIDCGTYTGWAEMIDGKLTSVETITAPRAIIRLHAMQQAGEPFAVVWEDARLRTWFGKAGREKLQGAGSIKRDSAIIAQACKDLGIINLAVKPAPGGTKWTREMLEERAGWNKVSSEHARDAAALLVMHWRKLMAYVDISQR